MLRRKNVLTLLILSGYLVGCPSFFTLSASATSARAYTTHYCQCVEYVNSYYGMHVPGNAYQWIANLPQYGWHQEPVGTVGIGDIAVWDWDAMPPYGHVAIVSDISDSSQGTTMTLFGANQDGSRFPSLRCNDVSYWQDSSYWSSAVFFSR
jgi:surface antigen